jgi:hypothetical protein
MFEFTSTEALRMNLKLLAEGKRSAEDARAENARLRETMGDADYQRARIAVLSGLNRAQA